MIPVFYTPHMAADSKCFSPSAGKPALVVADWLERGLPVSVRDFEPVTEADFGRVHDPVYVRGVMSGRFPNGFGTRDPKVAQSLRYTTGSMLAAARHALGRGVACSPSSGFHHAGYNHGGGFCTFNGLMVAAASLADSQLSVGVFDCDQHYGDGTDDILQRMRDAGKLHTDRIHHVSVGKLYRRPEHAEAFLSSDLPGHLEQLKVAGVGLLLYQAGADPHVNDPLGGWLTTEQLRERDRIVFEFCHREEIAVAWNLAGGYQKEADGSIPKVLEIHRNTMEECVRIFR